MSTRARLSAAFAVFSLLLAGALGLIPGPSSAAHVYMFTEDFDGDWPPDFYVISPVPGSWKVVDNNAASGIDYWGRTSYRSQGGTYSAWCAQNGVNSLNLQENRLNHYYDQDMQACMMVYLGNIEGYSAVYLSFAYWAKTGTESPSDHLEVRAFTGTAWVDLWTQPNVGNMTWEWVTRTLPASTIWVGWFFFSDAEVGMGPYEGVYVDSIQIAGNDVDRPASSAGPLEQYWVGDTVYVPYIATDSFGSGVKSVELYYRFNATGNFQLYAPPENPSGEWNSGMIAFNATLIGGDGVYEFYTLATDNALNEELAPGSPDAYAILDNSLPSTAATTVGETGIYGWYSSDVHLYLSAYDTGSGINNTMYRVGTGGWQTYDEGVLIDVDGIHSVQFYSDDRSGNNEQIRVLEIRLDQQSPILDVLGPLDGAGIEGGDMLVSWECSDETSGIDRVVVTVDGEFSEYCSESTHNLSLRLEPGEHNLVFTAVDKAGNLVEASVNFEILSDEEAEVFGDLLPLITIAAFIILLITIMTLLLRRRTGVEGGRAEGRLGGGGGGERGAAMRPEVPSAPAKKESSRKDAEDRDQRSLGGGQGGPGAEPMRPEVESAPSRKKKPGR
ncbi:MAG: hypothetical protein JW880_00125 [Candidatus Thermoplasmatota archaeon]|nr:hypothetical protein [Candidatus Thermoplasmatota archaeon]